MRLRQSEHRLQPRRHPHQCQLKHLLLALRIPFLLRHILTLLRSVALLESTKGIKMERLRSEQVPYDSLRGCKLAAPGEERALHLGLHDSPDNVCSCYCVFVRGTGLLAVCSAEHLDSLQLHLGTDPAVLRDLQHGAALHERNGVLLRNRNEHDLHGLRGRRSHTHAYSHNVVDLHVLRTIRKHRCVPSRDYLDASDLEAEAT